MQNNLRLCTQSIQFDFGVHVMFDDFSMELVNKDATVTGARSELKNLCRKIKVHSISWCLLTYFYSLCTRSIRFHFQTLLADASFFESSVQKCRFYVELLYIHFWSSRNRQEKYNRFVTRTRGKSFILNSLVFYSL